MSELNPALAAFNAGRFGEAHQLLTRLLRKSSTNLDALYLLAVTEQARQNHEASLALFDRLLAYDPAHSGAHYNKALLLSSMGQHHDALPHHDRSVQLAPTNFWAYINRGNARAALERFAEAIADYDQALKIAPGLPDALTNKGNALTQLGQFTEALACLDEAVQRHPQHAQARVSRCQILTKLERYDEAIDSAEQALKLQPKHPEAWVRKGIAFQELGEHDNALADIERAIDIHPQYAEAWSAHGDTLQKLNRYTEAIASYEKCLTLQPHLIQAYVKKALALQGLGDDVQAKSCYEHAIKLEPDHADAHLNLALMLLRQHDYTRGWEQYEYRWRSKETPLRRLPTSRPLWLGTQMAASVLLWGEQGVGDQIIYASILPELASYPQQKLVALDKRLLPLFERSIPGYKYEDLAQASDALDFATQLPLGSLPRHFRSSIESFFSARHPYLIADPVRTVTLRQRIACPGKRVCGVSWSSNRKSIGAQKSISLDQMLVPLACDQLHFVNLQYGDTSDERQALQAQHGITVQSLDEVDNFNDIDGLAALIEACDIVITTSNTTAHLAGALRKETLLLLPFGRAKLWYWTEQLGQNPWYPSIRSFAQPGPGQWQRPLELLKRHMENKA